jgi:hypothetical protein
VLLPAKGALGDQRDAVGGYALCCCSAAREAVSDRLSPGGNIAWSILRFSARTIVRRLAANSPIPRFAQHSAGDRDLAVGFRGGSLRRSTHRRKILNLLPPAFCSPRWAKPGISSLRRLVCRSTEAFGPVASCSPPASARSRCRMPVAVRYGRRARGNQTRRHRVSMVGVNTIFVFVASYRRGFQHDPQEKPISETSTPDGLHWSTGQWRTCFAWFH